MAELDQIVAEKLQSPLVAATGEAVILTAGSVHLFDDPQSVWLICDGAIELLAVERKHGQQTGPGEYLAGLRAGALIWGIRQSAARDGIHLLALSVGQTRLLRFSAAEFDRLVTGGAGREILTEAADQWIAALSHGATRYLSPRGSIVCSLAPGETQALAAAERVSSRKGIVWVGLDQSGGTYVDVAKITPQSGEMVVPLAPASWLAANNPQTIDGRTTNRVALLCGLGSPMDHFHALVLQALSYGFRNAASTERARLERRAGKVASDTEQTFANLAALLTKDIAAHRPTNNNDDTLFACCSRIGKELRTPMTMPSRVKRRRAGDTPIGIEDIAMASRMRVRQVVLHARWWEHDLGPLVGYLAETGQPVALLPRSGNRYVLYDPTSGGQRPVTEAVATELSSLAHVFYPSLPSQAVSALDLLRFGLARSRGDLLTLALTGALGGLVATFIPLATGYIFDAVIPGHQSPQMIQAGLALLVAALAAAAFRFASEVAQLRVEGRLSGCLQAALMDRLLRLPNTFFHAYSSGDLAQRTMTIELIRRSLTGAVLGSLVAGVFSVFNFALMVYYAPLAAALVGLLSLIAASAAVLTGTRLTKAVTNSERVAGQLNSLVLEIVSAISKLRLAGAEERAFNIWGNKAYEMRRHQVAAQQVVNAHGIFWSGFEVLGLAAIFGVIAKMSGSGVSTGAFLAFIAAFTGFLSSIGAMARSAISLFAAAPLYRRALPILQEVPESAGDKADPGVLRGELDVNGVIFRYSAESPRVLNGVSIQASPGEFIAITGPSGCGKSTLARLLLGFERPESGGIFFDGCDLRGLDLQRVRRQIGVVLQNGRLMPGSIYENIRGATHATLEECWAAAAQAGIDEEIRAMPMGMHTVLTEGTTALSGGQVQRILIARAIVGKPRLIIMDEATSALDNRTQAMVTESLDRLSVTRVVIAHRLSTIINADRIYVLNKGRVAESGNYEQLMEANGIFADLVRRQQL